MDGILKIKVDGEWMNIPAIVGEKGEKGEKGESGKDGQRGTSIIKVTTMPESFTTVTADKTPIARMNLSSIKALSGASEVLVGDIIAYSHYQYHIYYTDYVYAYMDSVSSIKGDTGATGDAGRGIESLIRTQGNGAAGTTDTYKLTYTDGNYTTFTVYNGKDGVDGTDGSDGASVTVTNVSESTSDGGNNVVTFSDGKTVTIKNGSKGSAGKDGSNGTNGTSVTHSWNGTTLTVTSASGTSSADLKGEKGEKGESGVYVGSDPVPEGTRVQVNPNASETFVIPDVLQTTGNSTVDTMSQKAITEALRNIEVGGGTTGENGATFTPSVSADGILSWTNDKGLANPTAVNIKGADGKTPVKGTDYFTSADKTEMVNSVIAALPKYTGGVS